jgi:hypothetical protein
MRGIFGVVGLLMATVSLPASGTAASSSGQIEQQFKQALDKAVQARPMPDDTP